MYLRMAAVGLMYVLENGYNRPNVCTVPENGCSRPNIRACELLQ